MSGSVLERKTFWPRAFIGTFFWLAVMVVVVRCTFEPAPACAAVPTQANQYRADLIRSSRVVMGFDAPIATLAAQIHQESGWRAGVSSPVGAEGLAQFMPATAEWMAVLYPALYPAQPFNPSWAIRAMVHYDNYLLTKNTAANSCEQWAMALAAYNGGQGWVNRDRKLASAKGADGLSWFNAVERFNAGRSAANFAENRHYVRAILLRWEPVYAAWGNGVCEVRL